MQLTDNLYEQTKFYGITLFQRRIDEDYFELLSKQLLDRNHSKGIYVSSNRSAKDLTEKLLNYKYDLATKLAAEEVLVVDLVSKSVGDQEIKGAIYVPSPTELSATQMAIETAIHKLSSKPGSTWLILDSIPTLLIFNGAGALLHFIHFLIGRLRVLDYTGIIFTVEGSLSSRVFSTVAQLCDRVIK